MDTPLLEVNQLTVGFGQEQTKAVDNISFAINHGETFVLLGESGSGKSITALSIMQLLPAQAVVMGGEVRLNGNNLFELKARDMRNIRGRNISMIFQEPQTSLNPVLTAGQQLSETLIRHKQLTKKQSYQASVELLAAVGIPEPKHRIADYPHQFSGGMKQRIMIAIALAAEPSLLIADEPTTALDVTIQAQILQLLKDLQKQQQTAILFITHDLAVAAEIADNVAVMHQGKIIELKTKPELFAKPEQAYTLKLFNTMPSWEKRLAEETAEPAAKADNQRQCILSVNDLKVHYPIRKGLLKRTVSHVKAVDGVTINIYSGETVAIVGESGSGKTTMSKGILQLLKITQGQVNFYGEDLTQQTSSALRAKRTDLQIIFQDPYSSMNPRMTVGSIIQEGMNVHNIGNPEQRKAMTSTLLQQVGLLPKHQYRYPHEFSGGQRQRICIARALAVKPKLLICDEPTSALDISIQSQILSLLKALQQQYQLAYLFITHNINVVEYIAHHIVVMYQGKIVEQGSAQQILTQPQHPYTKKLLAAVPRIKQHRIDTAISL